MSDCVWHSSVQNQITAERVSIYKYSSVPFAFFKASLFYEAEEELFYDFRNWKPILFLQSTTTYERV